MEGRPTLVDDNGDTQLEPGDVTTHVEGGPNDHHLISSTKEDVLYLIVGTRNPQEDTGQYPDDDLHIAANGTEKRQFTNKIGTRLSK